MFRLVSISLFLFSFIRTYGQYGEVLPIQFDQFYQNYSLVHPAATGMVAPLELSSDYKSLTGIFQGVNSSYTGANIRIKNKDTLRSGFHALGANIINSREGVYFNRGRLYFSYARHISITPRWTISGGLMLGIINHVYKGSDVYPGGSARRPTCDVGIALYSSGHTHIGLTASQIIPGTMAPLESHLKIKQLIVFSIDKKVVLSPSLSFKPLFIVRMPFIKNSLDADLTTFLVVDNIVYCGIHYKISKGFSAVGGIETNMMRKTGIRFFISYYNPFNRNGNINTNILEASFVLQRN